MEKTPKRIINKKAFLDASHPFGSHPFGSHRRAWKLSYCLSCCLLIVVREQLEISMARPRHQAETWDSKKVVRATVPGQGGRDKEFVRASYGGTLGKHLTCWSLGIYQPEVEVAGQPGKAAARATAKNGEHQLTTC